MTSDIEQVTLEGCEPTPGVAEVEEFVTTPLVVQPECILHYHACEECVKLGYKKCQRDESQVEGKSHSPLPDPAR